MTFFGGYFIYFSQWPCEKVIQYHSQVENRLSNLSEVVQQEVGELGLKPRCLWSKNYAPTQFSVLSLTALSSPVETICMTYSIYWPGPSYPYLPHDKEMKIQVAGTLGHEEEWRLELCSQAGLGSLRLSIRRWTAEPYLAPSPHCWLGSSHHLQTHLQTLKGFILLLKS